MPDLAVENLTTLLYRLARITFLDKLFHVSLSYQSMHWKCGNYVAIDTHDGGHISMGSMGFWESIILRGGFENQ